MKKNISIFIFAMFTSLTLGFPLAALTDNNIYIQVIDGKTLKKQQKINDRLSTARQILDQISYGTHSLLTSITGLTEQDIVFWAMTQTKTLKKAAQLLKRHVSELRRAKRIAGMHIHRNLKACSNTQMQQWQTLQHDIQIAIEQLNLAHHGLTTSQAYQQSNKAGFGLFRFIGKAIIGIGVATVAVVGAAFASYALGPIPLLVGF